LRESRILFGKEFAVKRLLTLAIYQSLCLPAVVYPVLGQDGKWNLNSDPFSLREKQ
jgi:hypothetical protein